MSDCQIQRRGRGSSERVRSGVVRVRLGGGQGVRWGNTVRSPVGRGRRGQRQRRRGDGRVQDGGRRLGTAAVVAAAGGRDAGRGGCRAAVRHPDGTAGRTV